jgi:hypothetical protein
MAEDGGLTFLDLPAEVRNMIYQFVLVYSAGRLRQVDIKKKETGPRSELAVGIIRASRQLHSEALPLFYGQNTFSFFNPTQLGEFLEKVGPARSHIRHIHLNFVGTWVELKSALVQLKHAKQLQTFAVSDHAPLKLWSFGRATKLNKPMSIYLPWLKTLRKARDARGESTAVRDVFRFQVEGAFDGRCRQSKQGFDQTIAGYRKTFDKFVAEIGQALVEEN